MGFWPVCYFLLRLFTYLGSGVSVFDIFFFIFRVTSYTLYAVADKHKNRMWSIPRLINGIHMPPYLNITDSLESSRWQDVGYQLRLRKTQTVFYRLNFALILYVKWRWKWQVDCSFFFPKLTICLWKSLWVGRTEGTNLFQKPIAIWKQGELVGYRKEPIFNMSKNMHAVKNWKLPKGILSVPESFNSDFVWTTYTHNLRPLHKSLYINFEGAKPSYYNPTRKESKMGSIKW